MGRTLFIGFVLAVLVLIGIRAYEGISDPALAGRITDTEQAPAQVGEPFRGWD